MNKWSFKSACSIKNEDFKLFEKHFPDNIMFFDELIETIHYLSSSVVTKYFFVISTSSNKYIFINCLADDFIKTKHKIYSILHNKVKLSKLKGRIRNDMCEDEIKK